MNKLEIISDFTYLDSFLYAPEDSSFCSWLSFCLNFISRSVLKLYLGLIYVQGVSYSLSLRGSGTMWLSRNLSVFLCERDESSRVNRLLLKKLLEVYIFILSFTQIYFLAHIITWKFSIFHSNSCLKWKWTKNMKSKRIFSIGFILFRVFLLQILLSDLVVLIILILAWLGQLDTISFGLVLMCFIS